MLIVFQMIFNLINYNYSANNSANRLSQIVHWNALNAKLLLVNSCLSCPSSWRPADTLVCVITRLRVVIVGQALRRTREASRRVTTPSTLVWSVQFASRLRMSINRYCVTPNMSTCRPAAAAGRVLSSGCMSSKPVAHQFFWSHLKYLHIHYIMFRKKHPLLFSCITLRKLIRMNISDKIPTEMLILSVWK